jgi:ribosomal protein L9
LFWLLNHFSQNFALFESLEIGFSVFENWFDVARTQNIDSINAPKSNYAIIWLQKSGLGILNKTEKLKKFKNATKINNMTGQRTKRKAKRKNTKNDLRLLKKPIKLVCITN